MTATAQWEVTDHNGEVVFSADAIASEPAVRGGLMTARARAKQVAKENSDPMHPPLQARKVA